MRRLTKRNFAVAAFIVIGGIVGAGSSYAATLVGAVGAATGIEGLVIDGVTYNVTFYHASYTTVYGSTTPTFLGNNSGATDAAAALAAALNALGVTGLSGISDQSSEAILVPEFNFGSFEENYAAFCSAVDNACQGSSPWMSGLFGSASVSTDYANSDFAVFTSTPLPAALPLFAAGLGGLGLLGWRRKRRAQAAA